MKKSKSIAVITGGTGGLGTAVAVKFMQAGFKVILLARDGKKLQSTVAKLKVFGLADYFVCQVQDSAAVKKIVGKIIKRYGTVDVLVNTAGILGSAGLLHTNNLAQWQETVAVNLFGTVNMCQAVLPLMLEHKSGKIINFAGGGAVEAFPNFSAYASSKAAVVRFTETLAKEYMTENIQVNAVSPGLINTKMVDDAIKAGKTKAGTAYFNKVLEAKKNGGDSPELAADLVLWLVSPTNKLTGKLISAKWDNWQKITKAEIKQLNNSSRFCLRRIDNKYFYAK